MTDTSHRLSRAPPPPPEKLRTLEIYATKANEYCHSFPLATYYLRCHIAERLMNCIETPVAKESGFKEYLNYQMEVASLNKPKGTTKEWRLHELTKFVRSLFDEAESEDISGSMTESTVNKYVTCTLLFDTLGDDITDDDREKRRFAKQKAVYIKKCLAKGIHPQSGVLDSNDLQMVGMTASQQATTIAQEMPQISQQRSGLQKCPAGKNDQLQRYTGNWTDGTVPPHAIARFEEIIKTDKAFSGNQTFEYMTDDYSRRGVHLDIKDSNRRTNATHGSRNVNGVPHISDDLSMTQQRRQQAIDYDTYHSPPVDKPKPSLDDLMEVAKVTDAAKKKAEYAISAINYGTFDEAISYLRSSIELLESVNDTA